MLLLLLSNMGLAAGAGGAVPDVEQPRRQGVAGGGFNVNELYYQFEEWKEKKRLERELAEQEALLKRIEAKKERVETKAVQEHPPAGALSTLRKLEVQERKVEARIETLQLKIDNLETVLQNLASRAAVDDDDDFETMMMMQ